LKTLTAPQGGTRAMPSIHHADMEQAYVTREHSTAYDAFAYEHPHERIVVMKGRVTALEGSEALRGEKLLDGLGHRS